MRASSLLQASTFLPLFLLAACQQGTAVPNHASAPSLQDDAWITEGAAVIEGYAEIGRGSSPYVFFVLTRSRSSGFAAFLAQLHGNAFADTDRIGIGCRTEDGIVSHRFDAWGEVESTILPREMAAALLASSPQSPIALRVYAPHLPGGGAAPPCFTHLSEIDIL